MRAESAGGKGPFGEISLGRMQKRRLEGDKFLYVQTANRKSHPGWKECGTFNSEYGGEACLRKKA